jgi:hypothetical protein
MQDNQVYPKAHKLVSDARLELDRLHHLMKESSVLLQLSRESIRESRMMLSIIEPVSVPMITSDQLDAERKGRLALARAPAPAPVPAETCALRSVFADTPSRSRHRRQACVESPGAKTRAFDAFASSNRAQAVALQQLVSPNWCVRYTSVLKT